MYLLNSDVCIQLLNKRDPLIEQNLKAHSPTEIYLCSIVKAELLYGARHSQRISANLQRLQFFFSPFESLPFDDKCAEEYGLLRATLTEQGKIIGPNDLIIAAIARSHDATLITHNTKEFSRIPNLRLEDWQS